MKNSKLPYILIIFFITLLIYVCCSKVSYTKNKIETQKLSFKGKANKENFILGEPVKVRFEFFNEGDVAIKIPSGGVEVGSLKVFIAAKNSEYQQYVASGWGRLQGYQKTLEPKQGHKYEEIVILGNGKPRVSHLSESAAKEVLMGKITTEYAFPKAGIYYVKGVSYIGDGEIKIESEPIEIVIDEPTGEDLNVWNQIKGNKEIAFLMQKGSFNTSNNDKKSELIKEVEQLIQSNPNSTYLTYLKYSLENFKKEEERRQEYLRNARTKANTK